MAKSYHKVMGWQSCRVVGLQGGKVAGLHEGAYTFGYYGRDDYGR